MEWSLLGNPVLIAVAALLVLSAARMNVVFSLVAASLIGGVARGSGRRRRRGAFPTGAVCSPVRLKISFSDSGTALPLR